MAKVVISMTKISKTKNFFDLGFIILEDPYMDRVMGYIESAICK